MLGGRDCERAGEDTGGGMIAALYVETGGVYYGLPDVDPWDEERDARLYDDGPSRRRVRSGMSRKHGAVWSNGAGRTFTLPLSSREAHRIISRDSAIGRRRRSKVEARAGPR